MSTAKKIYDKHPLMDATVFIEGAEPFFADINEAMSEYPFRKGMTDIGRLVGFIEIPPEIDNELIAHFGPSADEVSPVELLKYQYNKFHEDFKPTVAEEKQYRLGMFTAFLLNDAYEAAAAETIDEMGDVAGSIGGALANQAFDCAYAAERFFGKLPDKETLFEIFAKGLVFEDGARS